MDADIEERKQKLKDDYEMSVITLEQFTQGIVQLAVSLSWLWHTVIYVMEVVLLPYFFYR